LAEILAAEGVKVPVTLHETPANAYDAAREGAGESDKIIVFGSFLTVSDVMAHLQARN